MLRGQGLRCVRSPLWGAPRASGGLPPEEPGGWLPWHGMYIKAELRVPRAIRKAAWAPERVAKAALGLSGPQTAQGTKRTKMGMLQGFVTYITIIVTTCIQCCSLSALTGFTFAFELSALTGQASMAKQAAARVHNKELNMDTKMDTKMAKWTQLSAEGSIDLRHISLSPTKEWLIREFTDNIGAKTSHVHKAVGLMMVHGHIARLPVRAWRASMDTSKAVALDSIAHGLEQAERLNQGQNRCCPDIWMQFGESHPFSPLY